MASRTRSFHAGIDYGTSATKMVIRDLGRSAGEVSAWPVVRNGNIRIPSDVTFDAERLYFGREPRVGDKSLTSFKMRFAEAAASGIEQEPLGGMPRPARDVLTLNLWWLLTLAESACKGRLARDEELELGFTFGAPVSFLEDPKVCVAIARAIGEASLLLFEVGARPEGEAISWQEADELLGQLRADHPEAERYVSEGMLQPEAKAALLWAVRSPDVPLGSPIVEVDVGAGTTHASIFRIEGDWAQKVKDSFVIYKAIAHAAGMDGVCEALAEDSAPESVRGIRGRENHLLGQAVSPAVTKAIRRIVAARQEAWMGIDEKLHPERLHWVHCHIALCGGGSQVTAVANALSAHPGTGTFIRLSPARPKDLETAPDTLPFQLVAYGLSDPQLEFIQLVRPSEIEPMRAPDLGELRCYCGGKSWCPSCYGTGIRDRY